MGRWAGRQAGRHADIRYLVKGCLPTFKSVARTHLISNDWPPTHVWALIDLVLTLDIGIIHILTFDTSL